MGTESRQASPSRQRVFEEVARELRVHRDETHAATMAQALLKYTLESRSLVALQDGGSRAVFYTANTRLLRSVPFDKHGLDLSATRRERGPVSDPTAWVDANLERLAWVHPRYRVPVAKA